MKALFYKLCGELHGLRLDTVEACGCGNAAGRWTDPRTGIAEFAERQPNTVFVLGIHNTLLETGDTSCWENADGYLFKEQRSPAVRIRPGFSSDTSLIDFDELILKEDT